MITHVAMFRWNDSATDEAVAALENALIDFAQQVEGVVEYRFGRNLGLRQNTADFGIVAVFEDADVVPRYLDHPAHLALVEKYIDPILEQRTTVQFDQGVDHVASV